MQSVNNFKETIDTYGSESILRYLYAGTMGLPLESCSRLFFAVLVLQTKIEVDLAPAKTRGSGPFYGETLGY